MLHKKYSFTLDALSLNPSGFCNIRVDQRHRQYFLKRPTIAAGTFWRPVKTALTVFVILLHCLAASGLTKPPDHHVKLYNLCEDPNTPILLDLDQYRKDEIIFTTKDPNFTDLGNALYKGIPLIKLLSASPCITKPKDMNFNILANDQYVLYDNIYSSGGILSYELNSNPIPLKYGGPLKVLYKTFPSQEASIWHINSIVLGTLEKPSLRITTENGNIIGYDIDRLRTMENVVERIPFMLPRGYRIEKRTSQKIGIRYLPLIEILQASHIKNTHFSISTYSGHEFEVNKREQLEQLYLVFQLNEDIIPIQWGGPFILAFKNKHRRLFAEKQPYYFVHTIQTKSAHLQEKK
jgi:hypothetical protein